MWLVGDTQRSEWYIPIPGERSTILIEGDLYGFCVYVLDGRGSTVKHHGHFGLRNYVTEYLRLMWGLEWSSEDEIDGEVQSVLR